MSSQNVRIQKITKQGMIQALIKDINAEQHKINQALSETMEAGKYVRLRSAIHNARSYLDVMEADLDALQELDGRFN